MRIAFVFAAAVLFVSSPRASAADIAMLATGATKEIVLELIAQFEKRTGHKVVPTWTGTAGIRKRIGDGEIYDLVIVGAPVIDSFIAQGKVAPGSRTELMKSAVGVAVRAGASKPDIGSSEAVKTMLLAAKSIGYSTGPSGDHVVSLIERFGIADQIRPKLKQVPTGTRMETIIATGEAEIGFQQISELIHAPGVDYVGPLPPEYSKDHDLLGRYSRQRKTAGGGEGAGQCPRRPRCRTGDQASRYGATLIGSPGAKAP